MEFQKVEDELKKYRELYSALAYQMNTCDCNSINNPSCECSAREAVREEINFLVEKVLGYIEDKEVIRIKCGIHKVVPIKERCDEEIKFLFKAQPPESSVSDWDIDESCTRAIKGNSSLLIITNGKIFRLYAVGDIDGERIQELIFEYNLLHDDLKLVCNDLWCLCRKDCGRKIVVDFA